MVSTTGSSEKPLSRKLGAKPGDVVRAVNAPTHHASLLEPLPDGAMVVEAAEDLALDHAFVLSAEDLAAMAERLVSWPRPGGPVWISWPMKTSPLFVFLTQDGVRKIMLPTRWVDVQVCAVDESWSGLKFLRRRA